MKHYYAPDTECYYTHWKPGAPEHIEVSERPSKDHKIDPETYEWYIPTAAKKKLVREKRDELLKKTDYLFMPDYPIEDKTEWETYRQALRDITEQDGFPDEVNWPEKPEV